MDHTEITPTWATVELPILRAIVQAEIDGADLDDAAAAAARSTGASTRYNRVISSLIDADYLHGQAHRAGNGEVYSVGIDAPSERARRAVGQWPTAEGLATALADAFEQAADAEDDAERKLSYREAAKAVLTGVAIAAITKVAGL